MPAILSMQLVTGQARLRRACPVTNCGFGVPNGHAKPTIGFKMRIAEAMLSKIKNLVLDAERMTRLR
jgi:hypothetical protein